MNPTNASCQLLRVVDALKKLSNPEGKRFATIFEYETLVVEIYAPRGTDPQQPHTRDEVYFVASGTGEYVCGERRQAFGPTDLLFAAAGVAHRFENFTDDLLSGFILWTGGRRTCRKLKRCPV